MSPRTRPDSADSNAPGAITRARNLRRAQTPVERKLWWILRDRRLSHYKFRRQLPVGDYIADFCCLEKRLIVEVDGDYHSNISEADHMRQQTLEALGFRVARFLATEVMRDPEAVRDRILALLQAA
jgi:very-short-patch-repair endonuclease